MNFRRQPFQFSTIDPVKRQAELQKRFGLPTTNKDMFVDFLNQGVMGAGIKGPSSLGGSPRLQHRVPVFSEKAAKDKSEQNNVDSNHKPRVRVIPIQVEGVDGGKRHRTFSGPAGMSDGNRDICNGKLQDPLSHLDSVTVDERPKAPSKPRVCTIPIQIEPREEKPSVNPSPEAPEPAKKLKAESNGCAASNIKKEEPQKAIPLKQIEDVLNKLKLYTDEVEKFNGTSKDKQYRYLDEMLTRCMLDLDNVDTMGLDEIRKARKEAVKQVQHYVYLLDMKVSEPVEKMDSDSPSVDNLVADSKDEEMVCDIPTEASNTVSSDNNNSNESQDLKNKCISNDIEICGDVVTEVNNVTSLDTKDLYDSSSMNKSNITDVEMVEENILGDSVPDITNEKNFVHDCPMKVEELGDSAKTDVKDNLFPKHETEIESMSSNAPGLGLENSLNKSEIVIEELDDSLENESNTSVIDESVLCVVSDSPVLDVKETIIEEPASEIVIEEVDDLDKKDVDHSLSASDSSVNKVDSDEKLSVEYIKGDCDMTDANLSNCAPVLQEEKTDSKVL